MALQPTVLDTDIISAVMREDLEAKQARRQIADFEALCNQSTILSLTKDAVAKAAEIYGDLARRGQLVSDADILIAASALVHGLGVVTNNERHFQRIKGFK